MIKRHLHLRMTCYYSAVMAVFLVCLLGGIQMVLTRVWQEQMGSVAEKKAEMINGAVSQNMAKMEQEHYELLHNATLQSYMKKQAEEGLKAEDKEALQKELWLLKQSNANLRSIALLDLEGKDILAETDRSLYDEQVQNGEFAAFREQQNFRRYAILDTSGVEGGSVWENTISYYGQFYGDDYTPEGYVILNWKSGVLVCDIPKLCGETFEQAYLLDENGNCLYRMKAEETDSTAPALNEGNGYRVFEGRLNQYPRWTFCGVVSYKGLTQGISGIYRAAGILAVLMLLIVILVSLQISKGITRPIHQIRLAMRKLAQGEKPSPVQVKTQDEIRELGDGFNVMMDELEETQKQVLKEQEEKKNYEVSIVENRLELLQSQINPHFIHNTLNTFRYMAQKEGNAELAFTIAAFNQLLRVSMAVGKDYITLREEVQCIRNYIKIARQRYEAPVEMQYEVEVGSEQWMIPKMILQPLVENSLFHGVIPNGGGRITVRSREIPGGRELCVGDDGVGIPEEQQEKLMTEKNRHGYTNIGLVNVNERLKLYYGSSCSLKIESGVGKGTRISFVIPEERQGETCTVC